MNDFTSPSIAYSPRNAVGLAKASRLAYKTPAEMITTTQQWGFDRFHFFDSGNTEAFIAANQNLVILSFRGTEPTCTNDWMTDARIRLVPACGGLVHRGFLAALNLVWPAILQQLTLFRDRQQTLLVTGHSLGAALATLAAVKLQEAGHVVNGLYTYGSPRVGDKRFSEAFERSSLNIRSFRFVNHNDVVTRVPPRSFGYSHVGHFLYLDSDGKLHDDIRFWDRFLETITGGIEDFLNDESLFGDHDILAYEANLQLNLESPLNIQAA